MERTILRIALWLTVLPLWAGFNTASAEGPDFSCDVTPLVLPATPIASAQAGEAWEQFPLGPGPGHIGWLSWDGDQSLNALVQSLNDHSRAELYRDPLDPSQTELEPGAWMGSVPGVRNAKSVRQALDGLLGQRIRVPLYDVTRGNGGRLDYRLQQFAWVVPQAYRLRGKRSWLSFVYQGEAPCRENQPPVITSLPPASALSGETYRYTIEATDPDFDLGDTLTYQLVEGPAGIAVEPTDGELSWLAGESWGGTNRNANTYCHASAGSESRSGAADVVMVVDESGSMGGEHAWLKGLALPLEAHLKANGVGNTETPNRYGLLGYERTPRPINVGGTLMGDWAALRDAARNLRLYGGIEDGWRAIAYALNDYPLRDQSAKNIILITDEGRNITDSNISYDSLLDAMQTSGAVLNAVVNARFVCRNGRGQQVSALGMNAAGTGYLADGEGGYRTCSDARATWGHKNATNTLDVYVELALDSGGAAWDLDYLRAGGDLARSFTEALIDIKVREIRRQLPPEPLADLFISRIAEHEGVVDVEVGNRGLADVSEPVQVNLLDADGSASASETLTGLAQGERLTVSFPIPDDTGDRLTASLSTGAQECNTENNGWSVPWITVRAEDWNGLYDEQRFSLDILNANRPPAITSTPPTEASAGAIYRYSIEAHDPDRGDALHFSLASGPPGMDIDPVTGAIRFKPDAGQLGEHPVRIRAEDLQGAATEQAFTLTVAQDYLLPHIVSTPFVRAVQSLEYRYRLEVEHDAQAQLDHAILYGPDGLSIDEQGQVSWLVPDDFAGKSAEVVIRVGDQFGNYDLQFVTLIGAAANHPPQISSTPPGWVESGQTYRYAITASDPDGDPLEYQLESAPAGMRIDADSGSLTWQPQAMLPSPVSVSLAVRDPYGATATQSFAIALYDEPNYPPTIDSEPPLQAWVGQPYSYQLALSDANGDPLEVTLETAPDGVSWDAQAYTLSWTPTLAQVGTHPLSIKAVDPRGGTVTQSFSVEVAVPNHPPVFNSTPSDTVTLGEDYLYHAQASDPDGDTVSYHLLQAPSGALLNGVSGELSWTPAAGGEYTFVLEARDDRGAGVEQRFSVEVLLPPSLCHAPYVGN